MKDFRESLDLNLNCANYLELVPKTMKIYNEYVASERERWKGKIGFPSNFPHTVRRM